MNTTRVIKRIILSILALLFAGLILFIGYYFYCKHYSEAVKSDVPMTKDLCLKNGGEWSYMDVERDTGGHRTFFCICHQLLLPSSLEPWVNEDLMEKCP